MIEQDIYTSLNTAFPELEGRIYPLVMPQDTSKNSLTYRFLSQSEDTCMEGGVYDKRRHVQIDVWAETYLESINMAEKVATTLHTDFNISGLFTVDIYEDYTLRYRRVVDFRIL